MTLMQALKRRIAKRLSQSTLVQNAIIERLQENPSALAELGGDAKVFSKVLDGAAEEEASLTRIIDHPAVVKRLMRSPKAFEKLMAQVAANPESLYRVLGQRNVRKSLAAQTNFLNKISADKRTLLEVLKSVPADYRADIIRMLVEEDASVLRKLGDTPEALAAALLYQTKASHEDVDQLATSEKVILNQLIARLEDQLPHVISTLAEKDPDLFREGPLHDQAIRAVVSDAGGLSELCALYAVSPQNGKTPGERLNVLLTRLFQEPVVVQALIKDEALRTSLAHLLQDSSEAAGYTVSDVLSAPRADKTETA